MPTEEANRFTSLADFRSKFYSLFTGPTFYSAFTKLDDKLRKKIMITVSIANNCTE
jgi:hypothetical protein